MKNVWKYKSGSSPVRQDLSGQETHTPGPVKPYFLCLQPWICKSFSRPLEQSFWTIYQNNFENKIPFLAVKTFMTRIIHLPFSVICIKTTTVTTQQQKTLTTTKKNWLFFLLTKPFIFSLVSLFFYQRRQSSQFTRMHFGDIHSSSLQFKKKFWHLLTKS